MDGVLIIDKPVGPTSHDVVASVRRATGWAKIGHTGTLDPMATGVLPLVVGRATRLARFLTATDKVYEADIRLGWATDTYDAEGRRIEVARSRCPEVRPSTGSGRGEVAEPCASAGAGGGEVDLDRALDRFRGTYLQASPPFSAKKIDGVPAYSLARRGMPTPTRESNVTVYDVTCIAHVGNHVRVRLCCSSGFYVRTFAHELGMALGTGGHLTALRRTRSGDFLVADAVALDVVVREGQAAGDRVIPLERLLPSMPAVVVSSNGAARACHGNDIGADDIVSVLPDGSPPTVRVLDQDGALLAIAEPSPRPGFLHPGIVVR